MKSIIKSIPTKYNGYTFRSRLEARWAVFFDELKIEYEYEKEGYEIAGIKYLPDFWLKTVNMWAEVKPEKHFDKAAKNLCIQLANQTEYEVLLLGGLPVNRIYFAVDGCGTMTEYLLTNYHQYPQNEHRFYCMPGSTEELTWMNDTISASNAALSAQFEFGKSGKQ